jgi:GDP-L-fucose synthase
MRKILVLGGSGFIGRNLVEYLSKKYDVIAPSHKELELLDAEAVKLFFSRHNFDIVIFAVNAGNYRVVDSSQEMLKKNLKIFFNVVANKKFFDRMIFFGSGAEYDRFRDLKNVKESEFGKCVPGDDYGFYKYVCSRYIENTDFIVNLRLFAVFGKYEDYANRFISNIMCRGILGLPLIVRRNRIMNYLYIDDLAKIVEFFILNKPKHKFYNVLGENVDLVSIAHMIGDVLLKSGENPLIKVLNEEYDNEYTSDSSLLANELPDVQRTPLSRGIEELFRWYSENKDNIDPKLI